VERKNVVGIDLGTTNTVVALEVDRSVALLELPQLVSATQVAARPLLPSFLYAPPPGERVDAAWHCDGWVIGQHARDRGGQLVGRQVVSAKSWLSHAAVDRAAAILPWRFSDAEAEELPRISPVRASALILRHVQRCYDAEFAESGSSLAEQHVVLTVPASFDAVARELTVAAAREAGLEVVLLEEPQAAFYDLLSGGESRLAHALAGGEEARVLVVDVGGGTTDLSLIRARRGQNEELEVDRLAVGKHLLLGGDNMDLALAHICEQRLVAAPERLAPARFAQLIAACRRVKERLLVDDAADYEPITLLGSGAKLVAAALKTKLSKAEVRALVLDGFFPQVALGERARPIRGGMVAFGLPYERDVAITRHIAAFVEQHASGALRPTALLLNGGVFASRLVVERTQDVVASWCGGPVPVLEASSPHWAVARGAVAYGQALNGIGTRIGGGSARGFYLGLAPQSSGTDRGQAICVLPRGAVEEQTHRVDQRKFELTVGKPVRFELFTSDRSDAAGQLITVKPAELVRLAPLVATLPKIADKSLRVVLEARLSAVGTLDLSCVEAQPSDDAKRIALSFDLRAAASGSAEPDMRKSPVSPAARYGKRFEEATTAIVGVYGKSKQGAHPRQVKGLVRELERIFGKRHTWELELNRALFDRLWLHHRRRRRGPDHERIFWQLAGFCLRPGTGHPQDAQRVSNLFGLLTGRLAHPQQPRSWQQFWIAWRRIAAGLDEAAQAVVRELLDPFFAPSERKLKIPKAFRNDSRAEMLELASWLERVPSTRRAELGGWVLERTWTERDPRLWTALGRIGARVPVYASVHQVVSASKVDRWLDHLLRERWQDIPTAARAAVSMCRVTGDRARDVSESTRLRVQRKLVKLGADEQLQRPVVELVAFSEDERRERYGEDLPMGLKLADDED